MRAAEIPGVSSSSVLVTTDDVVGSQSKLEPRMDFRVTEVDGDRFALRRGGTLILVMGHGPQDTALLRRAAGCFAVAVVGQAPAGNALPLHISWLDHLYDVGTLRLLIPDNVQIQVSSDLQLPENDVVPWLREQFLFVDPHGGRCAFMRTYANAQATPGTSQAARLVSRTNSLDLVATDGISMARRLTRGGFNGDGVAALVGDVDFTSAPEGATGDGPAQIAMSTQAYLDLWKRYGEIERDQIEQVRARIGPIPYRAIRHDSDGFLVYTSPDGRPQAEELLDEVSRGRNRVVLTAGRRYEAEPRAQFTVRPGSTSEELRVAPSVDNDTQPPAAGFAHLSLAGDKTSAERREQALSRIRDGRAKLPRLPSLLSSGYVIGPRSARGTPPLGPVLRRSFGESVTPAQREAIRVAVTTPDIAIIQGPPGTGKTRVIAALVDALSQMSPLGQAPRVLVTSEQNEAVAHLEETVQSATGVPLYGVGSPGRGTRTWARRIAEDVETRWADADLARRIIELRSLASLVRGSSDIHGTHALRLLNRCRSTLPESVSLQITDQLNQLEGRIRSQRGEGVAARRRQAATADTVAIRAVLRLPQTHDEVADGGWLAAQHVLREPTLTSLLGDDERQLITTLADSESSDPRALGAIAARVSRLRDDLLSQLLAVTATPEYDWQTDLLRMITDALALAEDQQGRDDKTAVIALSFAGTLRSDTASAERAHRQLADAFSATNQRAISRQAIQDMGRIDDVSFDTVIIDEAARASPLDLLIPMSLASRRIVLVGDHRQLPQMLEPDVERAVKGEVDAEGAHALDESLFERLLRLVREEDRNSGTRRVVTLDRQFRMHPWLGSFVSDAFYKLDGGLLNPDDSSVYEHDDPEFPGLPGVWIDSPGDREVRRGTSVARECEALAVSSLVHRWLEQSPDSTVGAMSLYATQTDLIMTHLAGLSTSDGIPLVLASEDSLQVHPELQHRLRIGNVDAFQGREFDFVALSLTRSNGAKNPRQAFGFLTLPNRLCVAMSRQKRLLAVVGDSAFFATEMARETVPAIYLFLQRCRENHAVR
jgi:hypothetical protein